MAEKVVYSGKIFEVVQEKKKFGDKEVLFEIARRAPGTRLIIIKDGKMLLSKEFRHELKGYDYRLPGGKVFDTLAEYASAKRDNKDLLIMATKAAERECLQEAGIKPLQIKHYSTSTCGATVEWN